MKHVTCMLLAAALCGCGFMRPLTAANADMRDYQDYALGGDEHAHLARKLALAQRYLDRHPDGAWAADVREAYDRGEAVLFERAKQSREGAIGYLTDLPNGPHAQQAVFLVNAFDTKEESVDERSARLTERELAEAARERDEAVAWITSAIAAVITDVGSSYDLGLPIVKLVIGEAAPTWGERTKRDLELPYLIPGKGTRDPRALASRLSIKVEDGIIVAATFRGADLFVRWTELDTLRALDESKDADRKLARDHVREVLAGMIEARLPVQRCSAPDDATEAALVARKCDGLAFSARSGASGGEDDVVSVSATPTPK